MTTEERMRKKGIEAYERIMDAYNLVPVAKADTFGYELSLRAEDGDGTALAEVHYRNSMYHEYGDPELCELLRQWYWVS